MPTDAPHGAHGYVVNGGVLGGMTRLQGLDYLYVDGLDDCIEVLKSVVDGGLQGTFIEMSACHGNCIGGTVFRHKNRKFNLLESRRRVEHAFLSGTDYDLPEAEGIDMTRALKDQHLMVDTPPESVITGILRKMGKFSRDDELNCGLCGYRTCRDKALAVYAGRAEVTMCMPYMKERAENY